MTVPFPEQSLPSILEVANIEETFNEALLLLLLNQALFTCKYTLKSRPSLCYIIFTFKLVFALSSGLWIHGDKLGCSGFLQPGLPNWSAVRDEDVGVAHGGYGEQHAQGEVVHVTQTNL